MANENKIKVVQNTENRFKESSGIYFTNYSGLNVKQATDLRKKFKENSVDFIVTKNTLTKIAAKNAGFEEKIIDSLCNGQIGIAYTTADPAVPAKVIKDFIKDNEDCLEVTGFFIDGENFSADQYKKIAELPSREELITKFVVGLNSPMTKFATIMNATMVKMVTALNAVKDKKE
jgi:large subunit ribosomal protein L10